MKIKNTRELKLRARAHAKFDHVQQGTYGRGRVNGVAVFKGCMVGCLSTPHRQADLRRFLKRWLEFPGAPGVSCIGREPENQHRAMAREFGISLSLTALAEGLFEAQLTHGEAIDFVCDFACSLPAGADIGPRQVRRFTDHHSLPQIIIEDEEGNWLGVREAFKGRQRPRSKGVRPTTKAFIAFCKAGGKVSELATV
jgi:hypothetical protein